MILGQIYETTLLNDNVVEIRAFVGTALTCSFEASKASSGWQTWELLGIEDADNMNITSLMSALGRVAMTASHKGTKLLDKALLSKDASKS